MRRVAYFPHDRLGDALVDIGQLPALRRIYGPCEIVAFCTEANRELFGCLTWCDAGKVHCQLRPAGGAFRTLSFRNAHRQVPVGGSPGTVHPTTRTPRSAAGCRTSEPQSYPSCKSC